MASRYPLNSLPGVDVTSETTDSISFGHAGGKSGIPVNIFQASTNFFTIPWSTLPAGNRIIAVTRCARVHCAWRSGTPILLAKCLASELFHQAAVSSPMIIIPFLWNTYSVKCLWTKRIASFKVPMFSSRNTLITFLSRQKGKTKTLRLNSSDLTKVWNCTRIMYSGLQKYFYPFLEKFLCIKNTLKSH